MEGVEVGFGGGDGLGGGELFAGDLAELVDGVPEVVEGVELDVDELDVVGGGEIAEARGEAGFGGLDDEGGGVEGDEAFVVHGFVIADDGEIFLGVGEDDVVIAGDADEAVGGAEEDEVEGGGGDGADDARAGGCRDGCGSGRGAGLVAGAGAGGEE